MQRKLILLQDGSFPPRYRLIAWYPYTNSYTLAAGKMGTGVGMNNLEWSRLMLTGHVKWCRENKSEEQALAFRRSATKKGFMRIFIHEE